ncbi:MAG: hypothetical protein K0U98_06685 [Deltaproteobacteria bacterium]|nr:hypothetical protein [Deltaproteobacteria bacterium]
MSIKNGLRESLVRGALLAIALVWALPTFANVDLVVQSVQWLSGPEIGNCNKVQITVRNNGNELGNEITAARMRIFPTGNSFQTLVDKNAFFSSFQPGQSQTRTISNFELPGEVITIQVSADAEPANGVGKLQESNENNNTFTQTAINVNQACGGGQCDLKATFNRGMTTVPSSYPAKMSIRFENIGGANCPSKRVILNRYTGTSPSGSPTNVGMESLQALAPGQRKNVSWRDDDHPPSGQFTYRPDYGGGHSDANNGNHSPSQTIAFKSRNGNGGGGQPPTGCDLTANFVLPQGPTTSAGNIGLRVRFKNEGTGTCPANSIKLTRYNNSSCSGYGSQVGGSRGFQGLSVLNVGAEVDLNWTDRNVRRGRYCYKVGYARAHNDSDNDNHRVQKRLSVN